MKLHSVQFNGVMAKDTDYRVTIDTSGKDELFSLLHLCQLLPEWEKKPEEKRVEKHLDEVNESEKGDIKYYSLYEFPEDKRSLLETDLKGTLDIPFGKQDAAMDELSKKYGLYRQCIYGLWYRRKRVADDKAEKEKDDSMVDKWKKEEQERVMMKVRTLRKHGKTFRVISRIIHRDLGVSINSDSLMNRYERWKKKRGELNPGLADKRKKARKNREEKQKVTENPEIQAYVVKLREKNPPGQWADIAYMVKQKFNVKHFGGIEAYWAYFKAKGEPLDYDSRKYKGVDESGPE